MTRWIHIGVSTIDVWTLMGPRASPRALRGPTLAWQQSGGPVGPHFTGRARSGVSWEVLTPLGLRRDLCIHGLDSFSEKMDEPHNIFPHIIGGKVISPALKYPFLVPLVRKGYSAFQGQFCGGSIVSTDTVLTAAHCCDGFRASEIEVIYDIHDLSKPSGSETIGVSQVKMHPSYNSRTIDYDVCTLKLSKTVPSSSIVALNSGSVSGTLTVAGWGNTNPSGSSYPSLAHEVDVPSVTNTVCNRASAYNGEITSRMNCAGFIDQGGKDACQGDSGGPIFKSSGGSYTLTGVTSWGYGQGRAEGMPWPFL